MALRTNVRIDPALRAQINSALDTSSPVSAVIKLRPEGSAKTVLPPEKTTEVADEVLRRVRERVGENEVEYYVLELLGAFNLVAPAKFVAELMKQPEVASAVSAEANEPALITPRNVKEVHLSSASKRSRH